MIYTEARFPIETEKVRQGKAPEAKFIKKNGYEEAAKPADDEFMKVPDTDEEAIPF